MLRSLLYLSVLHRTKRNFRGHDQRAFTWAGKVKVLIMHHILVYDNKLAICSLGETFLLNLANWQVLIPRFWASHDHRILFILLSPQNHLKLSPIIPSFFKNFFLFSGIFLNPLSLGASVISNCACFCDSLLVVLGVLCWVLESNFLPHEY